MPYIFGKLWHLAIIWAIRKAFQCIQQGVRFLLANHTRHSPTSENDSYICFFINLMLQNQFRNIQEIFWCSFRILIQSPREQTRLFPLDFPYCFCWQHSWSDEQRGSSSPLLLPNSSQLQIAQDRLCTSTTWENLRLRDSSHVQRSSNSMHVRSWICWGKLLSK